MKVQAKRTGMVIHTVRNLQLVMRVEACDLADFLVARDFKKPFLKNPVSTMSESSC